MPGSIFQGLSFIQLLSQVTGLFVVRSTLAVAIGFLILKATAFGRERKIYKMRYGKNQLKTELISMMKVVPFYSLLISVSMYFQLVSFSKASFIGTLFTFSSIFIWNEIWFYGLHRALHHPKLMFIHKDHHRSPVASPLSIASFSLIEQSTHVFCALFWPILVSRYLPITFDGLALYSLFQISVNILGHMNVEIYPARFAEKGIGQWVTTPTFHSLHHGRVRGHYGLLTTIPDRMFGTYFADYPKVQTRAAEGNGLTRAMEKVSVSS
jgi:Delta7-sterol 5-desaturase